MIRAILVRLLLAGVLAASAITQSVAQTNFPPPTRIPPPVPGRSDSNNTIWYVVGGTVSIGVAASRIGDLTGLLGRADSALYRAKEEGRNRVAVFAVERKSEEAQPGATVVPLRLRAAS